MTAKKRVKTIDQLYNGQNRSLQLAGVRYILDAVVPYLQADPNKRFVYVEVRRLSGARSLPPGARLRLLSGGPCSSARSADGVLLALVARADPGDASARARARPAGARAAAAALCRCRLRSAPRRRPARNPKAGAPALSGGFSSQGRLEFANGGWVMHDEASAHYSDMLDQMSRGLRFLEDEFGYSPRVGWQIDPFGHSATQASLLSAEVRALGSRSLPARAAAHPPWVHTRRPRTSPFLLLSPHCFPQLGFHSTFLLRIDSADLAARKARRALEFPWAPSRSRPAVACLVLGGPNYGPPVGFDWDMYDSWTECAPKWGPGATLADKMICQRPGVAGCGMMCAPFPPDSSPRLQRSADRRRPRIGQLQPPAADRAVCAPPPFSPRLHDCQPRRAGRACRPKRAHRRQPLGAGEHHARVGQELRRRRPRRRRDVHDGRGL